MTQSRRRVPATGLRLACVLLTSSFPLHALAEWTVSTQARYRHDDNIGNAESSYDIVGDSIFGASFSLQNFVPLSAGYSLSVGADVGTELYGEHHGLSDTSVGLSLGLRKKWGLGAYAPWVRLGLAATRLNYDYGYRDGWLYRTGLSAGKRLGERWNIWAEYAYERRTASSQPELVPGISGDAYSQVNRNLLANAEFSWNEHTFLTVGALARNGDVVSTTEINVKLFAVSAGLAADPAFGDEAYAYKIGARSYGLTLGLGFAATRHALIGVGLQRLYTRGDGDNDYAKTILAVTWDYGF
jgi:hypothetical protein